MDNNANASQDQKRSLSEFCEQLQDVRLKFHKWGTCERTVALYYLMTGLPYPSARFLQCALEQCVATQNSDTQILERNANNATFVARLLLDHPQNALGQLLVHLPLLKPGNKEVASCYAKVIRHVMSDIGSPKFKAYNECVEMMSYVFIHPAFDMDDKRMFRQMMKQLLGRGGTTMNGGGVISEGSCESSDECASPNPSSVSMPVTMTSTSISAGASMSTDSAVISMGMTAVVPSSSSPSLAPSKPKTSRSNSLTPISNVSIQAAAQSSSENNLSLLWWSSKTSSSEVCTSTSTSSTTHEQSHAFQGSALNQQLNMKPRSYSLSHDKPLSFVASSSSSSSSGGSGHNCGSTANTTGISSTNHIGSGMLTALSAGHTLHSSSSESRLQDIQVMNSLPAMRSILSWLKSLRLHKYNWVFHSLSYQEMLDLNEDALQRLGITKGARCKLLLSIAKLRERSAQLTEMESYVSRGGDLNMALKALKSVLQTPLQVADSTENLPEQYMKVMSKVCTQLLVVQQASDDNALMFIGLCERAESVEAFNEEQKKNLVMWRLQVSRAYTVESQKQQLGGRCPPWQYGRLHVQHFSSQYFQQYPSFFNLARDQQLQLQFQQQHQLSALKSCPSNSSIRMGFSSKLSNNSNNGSSVCNAAVASAVAVASATGSASSKTSCSSNGTKVRLSSGSSAVGATINTHNNFMHVPTHQHHHHGQHFQQLHHYRQPQQQPITTQGGGGTVTTQMHRSSDFGKYTSTANCVANTAKYNNNMNTGSLLSNGAISSSTSVVPSSAASAAAASYPYENRNSVVGGSAKNLFYPLPMSVGSGALKGATNSLMNGPNSGGSSAGHHSLLRVHFDESVAAATDLVTPNSSSIASDGPINNILSPSQGHRQLLSKSIDIENGLESLCLQMMEHALGP